MSTVGRKLTHSAGDAFSWEDSLVFFSAHFMFTCLNHSDAVSEILSSKFDSAGLEYQVCTVFILFYFTRQFYLDLESVFKNRPTKQDQERQYAGNQRAVQ